MQVDPVGRVVLFGEVARLEVLVGILLHQTGRDGFFDLGDELFDRADALHLRVILRCPDRQRRAPEARAREVPVHQTFEPLAEASRSGRFRLPADRLVEFDHPVAQCRSPDEPGVERIVEHRFVRTPAVGVGVGVLFDLENLVLCLEHHREIDVERRRVGGERIVVGVFHVTARPLGIGRCIDVVAYEGRVELFEQEEPSLAIDHRLILARLIDHKQRGDASGAGHAVVVRTERRGDMYDTRTVGGGHVVAQDDAERIARRLHPGDELFVADAFEVRALVGDRVDFELALHLGGKIRPQQFFGQDDSLGGIRIGVAAFDAHVFDFGTYGQCGIRGQCPGRGGPGQEVEIAFGAVEEFFAPLVADDFELRRAGGVLHVAVAARLVQFVGRKPRAGGRRVGLDGVTFVEQSLVEELFQKPPEGFDIFVVVSDVGVVHIDPVTHLARKFFPQARVLHHRLAAGAVVLLDGDRAPDVLLGDAEFFLDSQLYGQSVRVPSGLAVDEVALLRLVTAEDIFDRAGHDVMDARRAVGRGGAFVKDEGGMTLAGGDTFVERVLCVPLFQYVGGQPRQIEAFILFELHILLFSQTSFPLSCTHRFGPIPSVRLMASDFFCG